MAMRKITFCIALSHWERVGVRALGRAEIKILYALSHWEMVGVRDGARQLGFDYSLSPHPRPFSQREKGERP
jgi:hypothetical protein